MGTGVIGTEYASMLALLRIQVTLVDQRAVILDFVDQEIAEALTYHMRDIGVVLHLGEEVVSTAKLSNGKVCATFKSGKKLSAMRCSTLRAGGELQPASGSIPSA